jgi:hypothetical protein
MANSLTVSFAFHPRGGRKDPSTGRSPGHTWAPPPPSRRTGTMGTRADLTVRCDLDTSIAILQRAVDHLPRASATPQTGQPFTNRSTTTFPSTPLSAISGIYIAYWYRNMWQDGTNSLPYGRGSLHAWSQETSVAFSSNGLGNEVSSSHSPSTGANSNSWRDLI